MAHGRTAGASAPRAASFRRVRPAAVATRQGRMVEVHPAHGLGRPFFDWFPSAGVRGIAQRPNRSEKADVIVAGSASCLSMSWIWWMASPRAIPGVTLNEIVIPGSMA